MSHPQTRYDIPWWEHHPGYVINGAVLLIIGIAALIVVLAS